MRRDLLNSAGIFFVASLLLQPAVVFAGEHAHHEPSFSDILPFWLNFGIFCVVLFFLVRKSVSKSWVTRADMIESAVTAGERKMRDANVALDAVKRKEQTLSQEITQIQTKISQDTELESKRLVVEATARAEQVRLQAQKTAAAEKLAAENSIREELAEFVLKEAEKRLEQRMNEELDTKLRAGAMAGIPAMVSRLQ